MHFLYEASYTSDSCATQVKSQPRNTERVKGMLDQLGGRIESIYYAFGDYDVVAVLELPNQEAAAAFALAVAAGGSVRSAKTTVLMTVDEGRAAMRRASDVGKVYQPAISR